MLSAPPRVTVPTGRRVALIGATMCLLLAACGGADDAPADVASGAAAVSAPTPIPTTPPLSLPPADDTLPALAALAATISSDTGIPSDTEPQSETPAVPAVEASSANVPAGDADAASESQVSPAPTDVADTADAQSVTSPATGTDATEGSAPLAAATELEPVVVASDLGAVGSADRWQDCILSAAQTTGAAALLDPIAQGTSTDMSSVQLNSLAAGSASCDLVSTNLASTDLGDHVATASSCLNAKLESSGGGAVFVGLASIGWQQATPAWAQSHLVDALDSCFTGVSFASDVLAAVSANSSLDGAFDAGCLAAAFDASGTLRVFAQSLATNPVAATISISLSDNWALNCANVGQMVSAAAAADGVALSTATVACIDSELKASGAIAQLIAGTADSDAVGIATIACLTDAEAAALLN